MNNLPIIKFKTPIPEGLACMSELKRLGKWNAELEPVAIKNGQYLDYCLYKIPDFEGDIIFPKYKIKQPPRPKFVKSKNIRASKNQIKMF